MVREHGERPLGCSIDQRPWIQADVHLHQHVGDPTRVGNRGVRHVRRNIENVARLKLKRLAAIDRTRVLPWSTDPLPVNHPPALTRPPSPPHPAAHPPTPPP